MYATLDQYKGALSKEVVEKWLKRASYNIDILTYRRICEIGFDKLHTWQQTIITEITCAYADWLAENEDMLETYLRSHAINGVSMTMDCAWNLHLEQGTAMRSDLYALLETTGLTCASLYWREQQHV